MTSKRRRPAQILGGNNRLYYGAIVTFRNEDTGEIKVFEGQGGQRAGLRAACRKVQIYKDGPWRVLTISTPESIYRDLVAPRLEDTTWAVKERNHISQHGRHKTDPYGEGDLVEEILVGEAA